YASVAEPTSTSASAIHHQDFTVFGMNSLRLFIGILGSVSGPSYRTGVSTGLRAGDVFVSPTSACNIALLTRGREVALFASGWTAGDSFRAPPLDWPPHSRRRYPRLRPPRRPARRRPPSAI